MIFTEEMRVEDEKRWHARDVVTELGYCGKYMRDRKDMTNLDIRFYAYIMRKAHEMLKEQQKAIKYQSDRLDELLAPQKPRLLTVDDFKNNSDVDICGYLPCWVEPNPHNDAATEKPGWGLVSVGQIGGVYHRYWTGKPTQEQMEAMKWDG